MPQGGLLEFSLAEEKVITSSMVCSRPLSLIVVPPRRIIKIERDRYNAYNEARRFIIL